MIYSPLAMAVKLTLLMFFHQIFKPNKVIRWLTRIGMAVCTGFYVAIFFATVFLCDPVAKAYNPFVSGKCITATATPYASGVFNIISDLYILILPMPLVWTLQMSKTRKIRIMAVFSIGLLYGIHHLSLSNIARTN